MRRCSVRITDVILWTSLSHPINCGITNIVRSAENSAKHSLSPLWQKCHFTVFAVEATPKSTFSTCETVRHVLHIRFFSSHKHSTFVVHFSNDSIRNSETTLHALTSWMCIQSKCNTFCSIESGLPVTPELILLVHFHSSSTFCQMIHIRGGSFVQRSVYIGQPTHMNAVKWTWVGLFAR